MLRGGFGTNYSVTFQTGGNTGFSANTSYVSSNDANLTPANGLSNPFPGGVVQPSGSTLGLSTALGQGFSFADPNRTIPKVYNYSLALQQQLPGHTLLEVAFAGNDATQLPVSKKHQLPAALLLRASGQRHSGAEHHAIGPSNQPHGRKDSGVESE